VTNRELLNTPRERLGAAERQRRFLLEVEATRLPCPACATLVDALTAAGVDVDEYDFGRAALTYRCPGCGAELERAAPAFPGGRHLWQWAIKQGRPPAKRHTPAPLRPPGARRGSE
jgi:hypothetical protein